MYIFLYAYASIIHAIRITSLNSYRDEKSLLVNSLMHKILYLSAKLCLTICVHDEHRRFAD